MFNRESEIDADWNARYNKVVRKHAMEEERHRREMDAFMMQVGKLESENKRLSQRPDGPPLDDDLDSSQVAIRHLLLPETGADLEKLFDTSLVRLPCSKGASEATPTWKMREGAHAGNAATVVVFHGTVGVPDGGAEEALIPGTVELRANVVALEAEKEALIHSTRRLKKKLVDATKELEAHRRRWNPDNEDASAVDRCKELERQLFMCQSEKEEAENRAEIHAQVKKQLAQQLQALLVVRRSPEKQMNESLIESFDQEIDALLNTHSGGSLL